ncbi:protein NRT1/ PTR FAMILY 8.3-like [Quillaja saponaria]|uniref:Protein NRT1/ PTR FAMILY 8.3-like n=1 Tax=Quillaja saponaria TaxID=32244 RepID=A0AAD7KNI5_QUISA|nr:protein NRT1/ PTR FAMILY 8.3-like [Quillaja saponaria]
MDSMEEQRLLLEDGPLQNEGGLYMGDGSVDIKGKPAYACETQGMCLLTTSASVPALVPDECVGTPVYRFQKPGGSPLTRVCQVLVASLLKWKLEVPQDSSLLYETPERISSIKGSLKLEHSDELKCLDKASVISDSELESAAEVFTFVGQHEFFYEQVPGAMRSLCCALALLINAMGNYLSSLMLTIVAKLTTEGGNPGWVPDNLSEGPLDYFFWVLAGVGFLNLLVYIVCARQYK